MRCENKTFLQNDPGSLQEISSTAVEVGLERNSRMSFRQGNRTIDSGVYRAMGAPRASMTALVNCSVLAFPDTSLVV